MIEQRTHIKCNQTKEEILIEQSLTCNNTGFMVIECKIDSCQQQFLSYTTLPFKRKLFSLADLFESTNKCKTHPLKTHFVEHHLDFIKQRQAAIAEQNASTSNTNNKKSNKINFIDCYNAIFVEQPEPHQDIVEIQSKWTKNLKPQIGVSAMNKGGLQKKLKARRESEIFNSSLDGEFDGNFELDIHGSSKRLGRKRKTTNINLNDSTGLNSSNSSTEATTNGQLSLSTLTQLLANGTSDNILTKQMKQQQHMKNLGLPLTNLENFQSSSGSNNNNNTSSNNALTLANLLYQNQLNNLSNFSIHSNHSSNSKKMRNGNTYNNNNFNNNSNSNNQNNNNHTHNSNAYQNENSYDDTLPTLLGGNFNNIAAINNLLSRHNNTSSQVNSNNNNNHHNNGGTSNSQTGGGSSSRAASNTLSDSLNETLNALSGNSNTNSRAVDEDLLSKLKNVIDHHQEKLY